MALENLPVGNAPRVRLVEMPPEGICFRFPRDGHEEYIRACPNCAHRLEVLTGSGMLPQWRCPASIGGGPCSWGGESVANLTPGFAKDLVDTRLPEVCHQCGKGNLVTEVHRRRQRVEILLRHPADDPCKAEKYYVFHTFDEAQIREQRSAEALAKFDKSSIESLPSWTPEQAAKEIEKHKHEGV